MAGVIYIKKVSFFLLKKISKIFHYEKRSRIFNYFKFIYSTFISLYFRDCGKNFFVSYPSYFMGLKYMSFGDNFNSLNRLRIECWDKYLNQSFYPEVIIGNNVTINFNVHIGCINKIKIGNNVLIGSNVFITDHSHGNITIEEVNVYPKSRNLFSKGGVVIEDNVWIGENVSILPNVTIGKGSIIGANSVVTKSFPINSVIAGVPAKLIKQL